MNASAKSKISNLIVSALALVMLGPFLLSNYLAGICADFGKKININNSGSGAVVKYGGPARDFESQIIQMFNLFGRVISKENKKPLEGIILTIAGYDNKTVTDKNGMFKLEPPDYSAKKFVLEARNKTGANILQTKEVMMINANETIEISL